MPPGLRALHAWLDSWQGIGLIGHGLARQDRDRSLTRYRDRCGVSVFVTGKSTPSCRVPGGKRGRGGGATDRVPCAAPGPVLESDQPQVL
jgi:hypothetical protein